MAGRRRRTRQKVWRAPLVPFNKLPICHCGSEIGMKRMRGQTELCCLVCACNWIKGMPIRHELDGIYLPMAHTSRQEEVVAEEPVRKRSLAERFRAASI